MTDYDLVVVGAGPAGMSAALAAAERGVKTLVLDEARRPGGQIYRGIADSPFRTGTIFGDAYWQGAALVRRFQSASVDYLSGATVWELTRDPALYVSREGRSRRIATKEVIVATGAQERPMPIRGWTLPGVMTVGAAQTLLKADGILPAGRTILVGAGPLFWLFAAQLLAAGHPPALLLETETAKSAGLRQKLDFLRSPYAAKGFGLFARVRRHVPVVTGASGVEIGEAEGGLRITYRAGGRTGVTSAEHVLLHQGVLPNLNLVQSLGCKLQWNEAQACWQPEVDDWGASSVPHVAIAGDGAGIGGAELAALKGRLAGLRAASSLRGSDAGSDADAVRDEIRRYTRGRAFLDLHYRPAPAMRSGDPAAIVCRCEEVTGAELRSIAAATKASGPNQLKALTRCGMGPCQGRFCSLTLSEIVADVQGLSPAEVGLLRVRPPVKPITLGELATLVEPAP